MRNRLKLLTAAFALGATSSHANLVAEPTFQEKMELSELVVIATVREIHRGGRDGIGGTATFGGPPHQIRVVPAARLPAAH